MNKILIISLIFFLLGINGMKAQFSPPPPEAVADDPTRFAATITANDLKTHLTILASDAFEGRETGKPGNQKAADYIVNQFKDYGLSGVVGEEKSYFQNIYFRSEVWQDVEIYVGDKRFKHLWDFYAFPSMNNEALKLDKKEVIFLGYGIDDEKYSDYKGQNVRDKIVMIYKGEPMDAAGNSRLTGNTEVSEWSSSLFKKLNTAYTKGVKTVLIIDPDMKENVGKFRQILINPGLQVMDAKQEDVALANSCFISTSIAKAIIGKKKKKFEKARKQMQTSGKPKAVRLKIKKGIKLTQEKLVNQVRGNNVLGFIEGSDPKLKEELVVVTAHYDHLGKRGNDIYNGADDNGSGTSTALEICQAFTEAKKQGVGPRRSVLVMLVTGEEKGLLGSKFYTENPIFSLENTVVDINIDMVGRVDKKYKDNPNYIYVIGSDRLSTDLHKINEEMNKRYTNLVLDYTYNAEDDPNRYYYRSDHYNFAEKGIPAIFYFNGTHDDYHKITDTIDKINFEKMETIGRLVFHTAWEIANRNERIKVDVKP